MQLTGSAGHSVARKAVRHAHWDHHTLAPHALVSQLGSEVAIALTSALERLNRLSATGQIDRADLQALHQEIDRARRVGIMGQRLARLSADSLRLGQEPVDLAGLLTQAVTLWQRKNPERDIRIKQTYIPLSLVSDAALMFSMVEATLDWAFEHAHSRLVLRLDTQQHPSRGRLTCAFLRRPPDADALDAGVDPERGVDEALNTLGWRLMQQTASVLGLVLTRRDTEERSEMRLTLPGVEALPRPLPVSPRAGSAQASNGLGGLRSDLTGPAIWQDQPLAGRHVVVVAAQRELRNRVREALRPTGSMLDFVSTLDEAQRFLADAQPHALVYEAAQGGERLQRLRSSMARTTPTLAFIQIAEGQQDFELLEADGHPYASVGQDTLRESLPAALLFEMARAA